MKKEILARSFFYFKILMWNLDFWSELHLGLYAFYASLPHQFQVQVIKKHVKTKKKKKNEKERKKSSRIPKVNFLKNFNESLKQIYTSLVLQTS